MGFSEGKGCLDPKRCVLRQTAQWVGWLPGALLLNFSTPGAGRRSRKTVTNVGRVEPTRREAATFQRASKSDWDL